MKAPIDQANALLTAIDTSDVKAPRSKIIFINKWPKIIMEMATGIVRSKMIRMVFIQ